MHPSVLSADYFIVNNPIYVTLILLYYVICVCLFHIVKHDIVYTFKYPKQFLLVHNVISIFSNIYMFYGILYETYTHNYRVLGNPLDTTHTELTHYLWVFHLTKYYEIMDTVIMLLRKSFRQITFLHVYHHLSTIVYTWFILYNHPGGDFYLGPLINSWVHIWMYTYYLLASFMNKQSRFKYLWWSVYLTQLQIFQFVINLSHSLYSILYSPYDTPLYKYGLYHQLSFIMLFGHFYYKKHKKCNKII